MQHRGKAAAAAAIFAVTLGTAGPVAASTPGGVSYCTPPRPAGHSPAAGQSSPTGQSSPAWQSRPASTFPAAALGPVSRILGRYDPGYRVTQTSAGLTARSRTQRLTARFGRNEVTVRSGPVTVGMRLAGYGFGGHLRPVRLAAPAAHANRVTYQGRGLALWYANGPAGLEQGFTITAPPSGAAGHTPLTLALATAGGAHATASGGNVTFRRAGAALAYRNLAVTDARGRRLHAWLTLAPGRLLLHASTTGAHYPLTIDPTFAQLAKLTVGGDSGDDLGASVAISGTTLAVGAPGADGHAGAVYVFTEPAHGWANQTQAAATLTASGPSSFAALGFSVAIDGSTIVAGAPAAGENEEGALYVFTEPGGGWADETQTAKLTATPGLEGANLGLRVAISGTTIVGGAPGFLGCSPAEGAVYVFTEPGGGWADETQTAKLTASDGTIEDGLGFSVGVDGPTIVAGAPLARIGGNADQGALYVFTEPGGGWADETQTAKLTAASGAAGDVLGVSAAISGSTIVGGALNAAVGAHVHQGALYVFTEPGGGWADGTQAARLTVAGGVAEDRLGWFAATNGQEIVAGAYEAHVRGNAHQGAAYVYTRPAGGWSDETQAATLTAADGAAGDELGYSVSLSGDTVAAGAPGATIGGNPGAGAAYVFGPATPPPPVQLRLSGFLSPGRGAHRRAGTTILVRTRAEYANGTPIPGWLATELAHACDLTARATGAQSTPAQCLRWNPAKQRFYWTWKTHTKPTGTITLTINLYYHTHTSTSEKITLTKPGHRLG